MAASVFPLPKASYKVLLKIVAALAEQPADHKNPSLHQLATSGNMDLADVARNMRFLVSAGIVSSPKNKRLTQLGHSLAAAIRNNDAAALKANWQRVVAESGFMKGIVEWIEQQGPQDAERLLTKVTQAARAKLDDRTKTGRKAVLEILCQAGLLEQENKNFRLVGSPATVVSSRATGEKVAKTVALPAIKESGKMPEIEIAIHLPATRDAEVYETIFKLIKKYFGK